MADRPRMGEDGAVSASAAPAEVDARLRERLDGLVQRLDSLAQDTASKRQMVEDRMIEDVRQYHGRYDPKTERALADSGRSRVFLNETRAMTLAWERRLGDMLFPADEDNWAIRPTPVPELSTQTERLGAAMRDGLARANAMARAGQADAAEQLAVSLDPMAEQAAALRRNVEEAERAAQAMQDVIRDQLRECGYNAACRRALHDMVKLGTCVMKGPVLTGRVQRRWRPAQEGGWQSAPVEDPRPSFVRVDPWNWFPDMTAIRPEERAFDFERHLFTPKDLRDLAQKPGFSRAALEEVLTTGKPDIVPTYVQQLREITALNVHALDARYSVWEYHGELEPEEMLSLALSIADPERKAAMVGMLEADPLDAYRVCVWFVQGRVLKFGPHPLDSGDSVYSVANFERDDGSLFGFGIPYLMRDSQAVMNAAWRLMMDNAAIAANPPKVLDRDRIEPVDGRWDMHAGKLFVTRMDAVPSNRPAIEVMDVGLRQAELANIIAMARDFADSETSMPPVAQGEGGAQVTKTAEGLSLLMNSANVVFRGAVRNWDDDMTVPNIQRMFDWNMQHNPREDIKGDAEIEARGSSVLMVRDIQARNIMTFLGIAAQNPKLAPFVKDVPAARQLAKAMMLSPDDVVMSDAEMRAAEERAAAERAAQPPQPDPESLRAQTQAAIAKMRADSAERIEELRYQTAMMELAEKRNIELDKLRTMFAVKEREVASAERKLAVEMAALDATGRSAGGSV